MIKTYTGEEREKGLIPYHRVYAAVDLDALTENARAIKAYVKQEHPKRKLCAVVKADAYGHGAPACCAALSEIADYFAVATVHEGGLLRKAGIGTPVLVLGAAHPKEYRAMISHGLSASVSSYEEARTLSAAACEAGTEKPVGIHLAVDTGMSRIGLKPDEAGADECSRIAALPKLSIEGCFTHYASSDEADYRRTEQQLSRFLEFTDRLAARGIRPALCHSSNSGAILNGAFGGFDMVRAGIILYGHYPSEETPLSVPLQPVMSLHSYLSFVKEIEKGAEVSYGGIFRAEKPMRIGTVSIGYADGYPRSASGTGAEVLIRGTRCPVIGRVCMDQMMVDISGLPKAEAGDLVTLFGKDGGEEITLEELAAKSGGFHYEMMCGINQRVPRVYVKG